MSSKNRQPTNAAAPASILRRVPPNARNSPISPTAPFYNVKGANHDYDEYVPVYGNPPQEILLPQYAGSPQNISQTYYTRQQPGTIQEDENDVNNDDAEEEYMNEEELGQIDNVITEAADGTGENVRDRAETKRDNQIEYVKQQGKYKTESNKRDNMVMPSEVAVQKPRDPAIYDSRMAYNMEWQNAAINEANANITDVKRTDVTTPRHISRKARYPYQETESNQVSNFNRYIQDRNTEAWIKYQEAVKRATQARSPNRKPVPKQPLLKLCVGAEDSPSVEGIEQILGEMESNEMSTIKRDLKDFQKARRRLIYDATSIKPMFSYPPK